MQERMDESLVQFVVTVGRGVNTVRGLSGLEWGRGLEWGKAPASELGGGRRD
jgi:hypothetical protein